MRWLFFLLLMPMTAFSQSVKRVSAECRALFPFEPIGGRYVAGSLSQVAEYVEQWRATEDSVSLTFSIRLSPGYSLYEQIADSTLSKRVLAYFEPYTTVDSTITHGIDFKLMPHSRKFTTCFNDDIQRIKRLFATPIAHLSDTLTVSDCYFGASSFASLFHRFQREVSGADISLFAPPVAQGELCGDVYIEDIFNMFRYDNSLVVVRMSRHEIKEYLRSVYTKRYYKLRDTNSDLVRWHTPHYMHLSASGVSHRVNLTKMSIEDFSLSQDSIYTVVANSFIASKLGKESYSLGDYRVLMIRWLQSIKGSIAPEINEQWSLSPERWVEVIARRERINNNKNETEQR